MMAKKLNTSFLLSQPIKSYVKISDDELVSDLDKHTTHIPVQDQINELNNLIIDEDRDDGSILTDIDPDLNMLYNMNDIRVQNRRSLLAKCECERLRSSTQVSTLAHNIEYQKAKRHRGCLHYDLFIA